MIPPYGHIILSKHCPMWFSDVAPIILSYFKTLRKKLYLAIILPKPFKLKSNLSESLKKRFLTVGVLPGSMCTPVLHLKLGCTKLHGGKPFLSESE